MRQFKKDIDSKEDLLSTLDKLSLKAEKKWVKICINLSKKVIEKYSDDWKPECEIDCDMEESLFFLEDETNIKNLFVFRKFLSNVLDVSVTNINFNVVSITFKLILKDV